ncbi:TlpA family protein disulfide reductase [Anaerotignum lactatifermentans]|uniref:TlpA family protein disulfide reductase n=1 Tax=Anaerotignum lactatifermentans TaxID=160404 RepID=A0ABS2G5U8_9FIRM|nr:TlpA family protein disulfide reductase [Anaerotignum lactatifermentans]MBM6828021.1 TlpA family protein disulfide reductase [Anaerotignum lactatifermentans]MBM6876816.1 TlpA family protein disulfide reductase [Anaerotignum lactatifermentans]MBM6949604.1 TlpA family protein disulfide reductase [Anaerotignum lactatifermentans]
MKKLLCALFVSVFLTTALAGCSSDPVSQQDTSQHSVITLEDGTLVNESFNQETMTTLDGTSFLMENVNTYYTSPEMGFGVAFTEPVKTALSNNHFEMFPVSPYALYGFYLPDAATNAVMEAEMDEADQIFLEQAFCFAGIFRLPAGDEQAAEEFAYFEEFFADTQKLCTAFDADYYFGSNTSYSNDGMTEEEKAEVDALVADRENLMKKTFIFPPTEVQGSSFEGDFSQFETQTLSGETVTQDIFADYDLTMVKIWTTWCNNCISEMEEMPDLKEVLPEGVNIISICLDGADDLELTQEIVDYMGITYPTLLASESLNNCALRYIANVPTTLFVDGEGKVIGEPVIGVPAKSGEVVQAYLDEIDRRLALKQ